MDAAGCLVCALALLCLVLASATGAQDTGAPKRRPDTAAGNCAACHGAKKPLPPKHPATTGMKLTGCVGCHAKGGSATLAGKLPLSHVHQLSGLTCKTCHTNPRRAEPVKFNACLNCHKAESVFAATAGVKPTNPHDSPHYGKESDCNLCHHQHEKSENYCSQCHKFDFKVP
jgi:hypothetical protein